MNHPEGLDGGTCFRSSNSTCRRERDRLIASPTDDPEEPDLRRLHLLARWHGLQPRYWDVFGQRRCPGPDAVMAVLRCLGVPLASIGDVGDAIEECRRARWQRLLEPVCVSRPGDGALRLRVPEPFALGNAAVEITREDGERYRYDARLDEIDSVVAGTAGGERYFVKPLPLPADLPQGYHRCRVEIGGCGADALIIAAPRTARSVRRHGDARSWGAFLPLHALRTHDDWGMGDYSALQAWGRWIAGLGGNIVSTLPLLPTGADAQASPYSPASRLFWSDLLIDLDAVPELRRCPSYERLVGSREAQARLAELRDAELVEYEQIAAIKRTLLCESAAVLFSAGPEEPRRARFEQFLARRPEVRSFASFRAAQQRHGGSWSRWPDALRDGAIGPDDVDPAAYRSHLYGQWLAHEQLEDAARALRERSVALYLDLPLGVPADSYDAWRHREQFAAGVSAGAPPDTFFPRGQNWALQPLHPQRIREHGHDYLRACLQHHLAVAGILRFDHVMAMHRLFWVPEGFPTTEGVYVRYPARELWAILALESRRADAAIVGEDLGTVPTSVRRAMRDSGIHRIYVIQTEIAEDRLPCLDPPAPDAIACMNTHDMPTFASFRHAGDLSDLAALGFMDGDRLASERTARTAKLRVLGEFLRHGGWLDGDAAEADDQTTARLLRACLRYLADSDAAALIVNLEDLWLEQRPQNVPGTSGERPNWRRRARYTLEQMMSLPAVIEVLGEVEAHRRAGRMGAGS